MMVKSVIEDGTLFETSRTGAPGTGSLYDYPMAEGLHTWLLRGIGFFAKDFALTINIYYLLGYALVAMSALALFRSLSLPVLPSIPASLLFAFLPEHYLPAEAHLFLTSYYLVPLMVMVLLWLAKREALFVSDASARFGYRVTRKGFAAVVITICIGSGGVYYAFFALLFLAVVALYRMIESHSIQSGIVPCALAAMMVLTLLVNISPTLVYKYTHGPNPAVARRSPAQAEVYGLRLTQLVFPIQNHRIGLLARAKDKFIATNPLTLNSNDLSVPLGFFGACGFLLLIVAAIVPGLADSSLRPLASLNLAGFLTATLGGFGSLIAYLGFPQIRCYYRMCVYLGIFGFAAVLICLKQATSRLQPSRRRLLNILAAAVLAIGILDITPVFPDSWSYIQGLYDRDRSFVAQIEQALPPHSAVFQLPYQPFPEHGFTNKMWDYDHFRGYLFSNTLRWSYGTIKGREEDHWQEKVSALPVPDLVTAVKARDFKGIYIDTFGYADAAVQIRDSLFRLTGIPPIVSTDGRFLFFRL
jgi:phosphoglycerol transferase